MIARALACLAVLAAGACTSAGGGPGDSARTLTGVRFPAVTLSRGVARSNVDLAQDFIDLTFALENGDTLDGLLRYEEPVRIYLRSQGLAVYRHDIDALIARLRSEAGIDIALTSDAERANIFVEAVPQSRISRVFPTAACFIVPGETSWAGFKRRRRAERLHWSEQKTLTRAAIFLPLDTTPQDARDCLHEEITQALGPANDLYRLPDSIWNDDNFHGMATPFDMLMLRALYQPEMRSGMDKAQVSAALPGVLSRVNPGGRGKPRQARQPESRAWAAAFEAALSDDLSRRERRGAARIATQIALEMRPVDHRYGVSLLTAGRLKLRDDPAASAREFTRAYDLFMARSGINDIRTAQAGVHLAALAAAAGQYDIAIMLADRHLPGAMAGQNAILIAGFLSIKSEALAQTGRIAEARQARLDSLRWARYGFGDEDGGLAREQVRIAGVVLEQE